MKDKLASLFQMGKDKISSVDFELLMKDSAKNFQGWIAGINQDEILRWMNEIKFDKSIYDESMDSIYNAFKEGGGNHRLFDGGHTLSEAWEKVQNASPDDTFAQEVIGFVKSVWNDASTVKGMPFQTLEKASYDEWVEKISDTIPGVSKEWLYDLTSFDAMEITSTIIGGVSAIYMLNKDDQKKLAEILGSMSISSIMGANPLMGIAVIAIAGYGYFIKKKEFNLGAFSKSAGMTAFASALFAMLGLPFLIELVVVLVVSNIVKKKVLENDEVLAIVKGHLGQLGEKSNKLAIEGLKALLEKLENKEKTAS